MSCFSSRRWLEDDSDEDDNAGAANGDKEGKEEGESEREERGQDPPGSAGDSQPTQPPSRGQSSGEDTGVVAARALSDPQGRKECPRSPPSSPPPVLAAAQSPVSPTTTAAALHSLARGTSRHPHHTAPHHRSPPLALPRLTNPCAASKDAPVGDGFCVRAADKPRTNVLACIEETEVDDSTCEDESLVVVETPEAIKSAKLKDSTLPKPRATSVDAVSDRVGLTRAGTHHTTTVATMVARTDTNQGGKVASCPDDVQSLSLLPMQGKQEVDAVLLPAVSAVVTTPLHLAPQDLDGATSAPSSGDAASDGPSTPSTFCSDGEDQEGLEDEERSSENTPEPPDFSTHPERTGE
ncbi:hypothetical protein E2C01_042672 [Portunus trituberculatus]|uniref:Uncharacterized protein n=1 Tax=Portunus trituberculatus TaxID=210409 RepID=A0A5B7FTM8_PORTR|nr:hypothetical protein [Portunus trituberculatus]